jgi:hypothetical protein
VPNASVIPEVKGFETAALGDGAQHGLQVTNQNGRKVQIRMGQFYDAIEQLFVRGRWQIGADFLSK